MIKNTHEYMGKYGIQTPTDVLECTQGLPLDTSNECPWEGYPHNA